jgi:hypothetical protein
MHQDFGDLLDHSWYHSPDMRITSKADLLRDPIIQPRVRSLTRTLASQQIKSYLPLNRGGTRDGLDSHMTLRGPFHPTSQLVILKKWPHHLPGSFVYLQKRRQKLAYN